MAALTRSILRIREREFDTNPGGVGQEQLHLVQFVLHVGLVGNAGRVEAGAGGGEVGAVEGEVIEATMVRRGVATRRDGEVHDIRVVGVQSMAA